MGSNQDPQKATQGTPSEPSHPSTSELDQRWRAATELHWYASERRDERADAKRPSLLCRLLQSIGWSRRG